MKIDILFIDAISISSKGGGATHIIEILNYAKIDRYKFKKIYIFGSKLLLDKIPNYDYLIKITNPLIESNIFLRYFFIIFYLPIFF